MAEPTTLPTQAPQQESQPPAAETPPMGPILKPPKKKRKWKRWAVLAVALLAIGFLIYTSVMKALAKPVVLYTPSTREDIDSVISATGSIVSEQTKTYFVPASVKVRTVNFKRGDQVQKGQVIATFDMSDLQTSLRKAEIALENAQLQYDDTMENLDDSTYELSKVSRNIRKANADLTNLEIAEKFAREGKSANDIEDRDISTLVGTYDEQTLHEMADAMAKQVAALQQQRQGLRELDMSENAIKQLDNNLESLQLQVNDVKKMINESAGGIVADFDGVLTQLSLVEGATVAPGMNAAVLEGNQEIDLSFSLNKYDIQRLALDQEAAITFGPHTLRGTVVHIDGAATTAGGSPVVFARVRAEDPDHFLKLGMEADLDILTESRQGAVAVPIETLKTDKTGDYVYILTPTTGEKAKKGEFDMVKTYVKAGISDDTHIEILEGVAEGDLIATVVPKGVEGGIVVTGVPGSSSGGMLQLPGGVTIQQPDTME